LPRLVSYRRGGRLVVYKSRTTVAIATTSWDPSYSVVSRRREIAVRLAIGADPRRLQWSFVNEGLRLVTVSTASGILAVVVVARVLRAYLFGVHIIDLTAAVLVYAVFAIVCATASYLPARILTHVDAAETLRS
jgi:putative ABC transport system permease protein